MDQMTSLTSDSESDTSIESNSWLVMSQSSQSSIVGQLKAIDMSCGQSGAQSGVDSVNNLDDYSLLLIFSKLSFVEKLSAQKVCQKWQKLVDKLIRCQNSIGVTISFAVCQEIKHQVSTDQCIGDVFDSAVEDNTKWYFVNASNLSSVLSKCPNLKSLILQNCIFCREVLEVFQNDCSPHLEHLDLSYSSCNINEILHILSDNCSQTLRHVMLRDNEINETALKCLITSCKQLEVLVLDKNVDITGHCFDLFGEKISHLSIVDCNSIDDSGVNALVAGNGKHLTRLQIGDSIKPSMFQTICQQMTSLRSLEFNGFKADSVTASNAYTFISNLEALQELILTVGRIPFDTQLTAIISKCHDLRKVKIDGAIVTNLSLKQMAINCPLIEQISITPSDSFTNSFITDDCRYELASLSHLKSLSLCCSSITDLFVEAIISCPRLAFIEMDSCKAITNKSLDFFIGAAKSRPNDKILLFIQRTNISKPSTNLPSNLCVFGASLM